MKYYKLFAILILAGMMACSGEKERERFRRKRRNRSAG